MGPTEGSVEWFSASADEFTSLSCEEPNIFVFNSDGSFFIDYQNDTWIEEWQGGSGACSSPVAPWDASIPATWSYDEANSLTLIGQGSYLVLAKAVNGRELAIPTMYQRASPTTSPIRQTETSPLLLTRGNLVDV